MPLFWPPRIQAVKFFFWEAVVVESGYFSVVSRRSLCNISVNIGYFAEEASDFSVLYVFFSYLVPAYPEYSSYGAVVEVLSG